MKPIFDRSDRVVVAAAGNEQQKLRIGMNNLYFILGLAVAAVVPAAAVVVAVVNAVAGKHFPNRSLNNFPLFLVVAVVVAVPAVVVVALAAAADRKSPYISPSVSK